MADYPPRAEETFIHAGHSRAHGDAVTPPLVPASIFVSSAEPDPARSYGRGGNPTWEALEAVIGGAEEAHALVFASGQAAAMALMLALGEDRGQILLPSDGYYNIRGLAQRLRPHGATPVLTDLSDLAGVERQLAAAPSLLWAETPTNPLLRVYDIARLAECARNAGAPLVVDNTVATSLLQRPLDLGATASLCSLTKSGSGHSDVIVGAVTTRDASVRAALDDWRTLAGGIAGPFESWLALRGARTLPLRLGRQCANALGIARHLSDHPRVRAVHYPGTNEATLPLARRQMPNGFGPLLSFEVGGSASEADVVVAAAKLIVPATSFGGVESTWERRARWPGENAPASLIRLSAGIEPLDSILADIDQALKVL